MTEQLTHTLYLSLQNAVPFCTEVCRCPNLLSPVSCLGKIMFTLLRDILSLLMAMSHVTVTVAVISLFSKLSAILPESHFLLPRKELHACMHAQSCTALCNPVDCSLPGYSIPPGSSIQGISQARIVEWVAIPFFRGSS